MDSFLKGIAIKEKKRGPMLCIEKASVTRQSGVANDFRGKPGKRQVTVLSHKAWQAVCDVANLNLDWIERRANLLIEDLVLLNSTGKYIRIGNVILEITGETDPCSRMREVDPKLFEALAIDWRGGVCCRVISDGEIELDDKVELVDSYARF